MIFVLAVLCAQNFFAEIRAEIVFHVAATGNDSNAGDEATPFASIPRAQQAVREKIAAGLTGNVRVLIHGGTYELAQPLTFDPRDSGTTQHLITYTAVSNEVVVISGGRRITNWTKGDGNVWTAEIPEVKEGKWYFRSLYVNGRRAIRARNPNIDASVPYSVLQGATLNNTKTTWTMKLNDGQVATWKNIADVEIVIFGFWTIIRKRILSVDLATNALVLEPPYIPANGFNPGAGSRFYLENARAFLDEPGEWYLDRTTGILSYWPRTDEDLNATEVIAPRLTTLVTIKGNARKLVENLHFIGIRFYHTDDPLLMQGYSGASQGYYGLVKPDSRLNTGGRMDGAVHVEYARACSIEDSDISHVGGTALDIDKGCATTLVQANRIFDVGNTGISLGFHREIPTKEPWFSLGEQPHSNQIVNNEIYDCGVTYHDGVAILLRYASQTVVAHNSIHNCSHHGISIISSPESLPPGVADGYWIQNNDIQHVCQMLPDSGPIYFWGKLTTNVVISGNVIHDTKGRGAIYLDNDTQGYRIEQNVVYNFREKPISFYPHTIDSFVVRDNYWRGTNDFIRTKTGIVYAFNSGSMLDIPSSPVLDPKQFTVTALVNLRNVPPGTDPSTWVVCKNTNELTDGNYSLLISHQNIGAYLNSGGGRDNCFAVWSTNNPIQPGTWQWLALTYDSTNLSVYCDGKAVGTTVVNRPRSSGTGLLRFGQRADGYGSLFPGWLRAAAIYNRALSATEIAVEFSSINQTITRTTPVAGLVFQWDAESEYSPIARILKATGPVPISGSAQAATVNQLAQ